MQKSLKSFKMSVTPAVNLNPKEMLCLYDNTKILRTEKKSDAPLHLILTIFMFDLILSTAFGSFISVHFIHFVWCRDSRILTIRRNMFKGIQNETHSFVPVKYKCFYVNNGINEKEANFVLQCKNSPQICIKLATPSLFIITIYIN